jgi:hypothetical protein
MLKPIYILALAIVGWSTPIEARIGETEVECEARYGKSREFPVETGGGLTPEATESWVAKVYTTHGLRIEVVFDDSIAVFIRYSNQAVLQIAQTTPPAVGLTASEISHLRNVNLKDGSSWQSYRDATLNSIAPSVTLWKSSDKLLRAGYDRDQKKLFVCSTEFWNIVAGAIKERTKGGASDGAATRFEGL